MSWLPAQAYITNRPWRFTTQDTQELSLHRRKPRSIIRSTKLSTANRTLTDMQPDKIKKPGKKGLQHKITCTVVNTNDNVMEAYGYKPQRRRASIPGDLVKLNHPGVAARLEDLELENTKLKNEVNFTNKKIKELFERLRQEQNALEEAKIEIQNLECQKVNISMNNEILMKQTQQQQAHICDLRKNEIKFKEQIKALSSEITVLQEKNWDIQKMIECYSDKKNHEISQANTLQMELQEAHSIIIQLQAEVTTSNADCKNIEEQFERYKFQVKNTLAAKDKEILSLQQGVNLTEDTKLLVDEIAKLKQERDELTESLEEVRYKSEQIQHYVTLIESNYNDAESMIQEVHSKSQEVKQYATETETKYTAKESMVKTLREALNTERAARNRLETSFQSLAKELKVLRDESGKTISTIRCALREKEAQLSQALEDRKVSSSSSVAAINVADYDIDYRQSAFENLTNKLNQRQAKIDGLLAEKKILKIRLNKLEGKYKTDMAGAYGISADPNAGATGAAKQSLLSPNQNYAPCLNRTKVLSTSHAFGKLLRPRPFFRMILLLYVVFLHLWVATVLFASTRAG